ncbi:hypothetical protein PVAP13_6KG191712 [Panicum virgatum]|uniref:Uncharacterized protein n=1 Tax=Panicum virgatum TaxID=38727 RepID=A0A8T0RC59_PANVG|nr:hypothetical protein PVAP13_6KG191712 [Panicum virgatum]
MCLHRPSLAHRRQIYLHLDLRATIARMLEVRWQGGWRTRSSTTRIRREEAEAAMAPTMRREEAVCD